MTFTCFPYGMVIWAGFLFGSLNTGAVSPFGAASGLIGASLVLVSMRCLAKS